MEVRSVEGGKLNEARYTGRPIRRREDRRLITGAGRYVGDLAREDMLFAAFVRSPLAHGSIAELDVELARVADDVITVFTAADLPTGDLVVERPNVEMARPMLARDRVRYVGEPIAVVIGASQEAAVDALDLVWPDIEPQPVVASFDAAVKDTSILHPGAGTNVIDHFDAGSEAVSWDQPIDVTVEVTNQRVSAVPIEPLAGLAEPYGDGIRLWVTHQTPHRLRDELASVLDFPIEVTVPDVGGGFGLKGRFYPEFAVIAAAAHRLGRPVRWLESRRESMSGGTHGRDMTHKVRLAGTSDGRIRRCLIEITGATGAYPHTGVNVFRFSALTAQSLYDIEQFSLSSTAVVSNQAPTAPYRGAGRPEAAYAMERAVEAFARTAGLDPIDVRRNNLLRPTAFPYRTHTGALYDSGDYVAAFDKAIEILDLPAIRAEQQRRRDSGADPIGVGLGVFVERAGGPIDSGEYARTEFRTDGTVLVHTGSTSNGQGHETVWAQIAADVFDVPLENIEVVGGDTVRVAQGWGSTASRSAQIGASGVLRTAERVLERARELASGLLEVAAEDLIVEDGALAVAGSPGSSVTFAELAARAVEAGTPLANDEFYSPGAQTFPFGVHAAVAEVAIETGDVRILRLLAVDDCGKVLNPMIVDGQVHGSLAQGIGQAMMERVIYDEEGQLQTSTLMDYSIPHAPDMPELILERTISSAPSNPLGVKGAGESGCIGAPPAIVNAVLDALAPYGVQHLDMPLNPMNVWTAIREAAGSPPASGQS